MRNSTKITLTILILIVSTFAFRSCSSTKDTYRKHKNPLDSKQDSLILYQNREYSFQFRYPSVFQVTHEAVADTFGWSRISSSISKGKIIIQLETKLSFQPNTNLDKATFTVGRSNNPKQLKKCLQKQSDGYVAEAVSIQRDGQTYFRTVNGGVAGPRYSLTIQYRTLYNDYCYSIEQRILSIGISYFEPAKRPAVFDSAKVWEALDAAWQSFHFTQQNR